MFIYDYIKESYEGLISSVKALSVGFKHLFNKPVTIQYPEVKLKLPEKSRNRIAVIIDDCIGCYQCERACPVQCIEIETVKALPGEDLGKTSDGRKKALWVTKFDIDFAKCCFCGLCVYPCPTECIKMTEEYEYSVYDRRNLIYSFSKFSTEEAEQKKKNFELYGSLKKEEINKN